MKNSNLPRINVQTNISFNTLLTLQKWTDTELIISTNNGIIDENNITEEISSHHNSEEVIDHTLDENGNILINTEEETDVTSIHFINATIDISTNDDETFIYKYYTPFLLSKNHEYISSGSEYDFKKWTVHVIKNI